MTIDPTGLTRLEGADGTFRDLESKAALATVRLCWPDFIKTRHLTTGAAETNERTT